MATAKRQSTAALIKANRAYVVKTGYDRGLFVDELRRRAGAGDLVAAAYFAGVDPQRSAPASL